MSGALKTLALMTLRSFMGIYPKSNPEVLQENQLAVFDNFSLFSEYMSGTKIKGNSRVLHTIYKEGGVTKPLHSVNFYKAPSLYGEQLRHVLIGAGSTLQRVESNGTLTELATDRAEGIPDNMVTFDRFGLISHHNPNKIGDGDAPVKYDGDQITNLGVFAPGSSEDVVWTDASGFEFSVTVDSEYDIT